MDLRSFLKSTSNKNANMRISEDTALMHDLGLYGDEIGIDLLWFIEEKYSVTHQEINEFLGCEIMSYFRPEHYSRFFYCLTFIFPFILLYLRDKYEDRKRPRFTVGMLEEAIDEILKNRLNNQ